MNRLEQRYRFALRLLPAGYRELWEEEMVGAFLDSTHTDDPEEAEYLADYGRPSWSELGSVAALAFRLRLGSPAAPPRYLAWGSALRLVAVLGLLTHAAMVTVGLAYDLWLTGALPWVSAPHPEWLVGYRVNGWEAVLAVARYAWIPAYLALFSGRWRAARSLALVAVLASVVPRLVWLGPFGVTVWAELLFDLLLVLALAAFHRECPPLARRPWLFAFGGGVLVTVGLPLLALIKPAGTLVTLFDWAGMCSIVLVVAAIGHLATPLGRRATTWSHALAVLAAGLFVLRLLTLLDYGQSVPSEVRAAVVTGLAEAAALLAVGLLLAVRTVRSLRRLPSPSVGSAAWSTPTR